MEITAENIEYIGLVYWWILTMSVLLGWLRNNKSLMVHFILSLISLYFAVSWYSLELASVGNKNVVGFLYSPIIFVCSYALLRHLYKKIYNMEPDIAVYSGFFTRDNRGLNFLDYVTAILPIVLSILIGIYLSN